MNRIASIRSFINRERLYFWMLIFVALLNASMRLAEHFAIGDMPLGIEPQRMRGIDLLNEASLRSAILSNAQAMLAFTILAVCGIILFILGLVLIIRFLLLYFEGREPIERTARLAPVRWEVRDVFKVIIIFIFFGHLIYFLSALFIQIFNIRPKTPNIITMLNTFCLDSIAALSIIYTVRVRYRQGLRALGLTTRHLIRNFYIGLKGYIALVPILSSILLLVVLLVNLFHYEPPPQPIFEIFIEESSPIFLALSAIFVTLLGPIIEELFFRGFFYQALKRRLGVLQAAFLSAVVFSLLHTNVVGFLPIFVLGLLLVYLYEKSGSLVPSIAVHVVHNSIMLTVLLVIKKFATVV